MLAGFAFCSRHLSTRIIPDRGDGRSRHFTYVEAADRVDQLPDVTNPQAGLVERSKFFVKALVACDMQARRSCIGGG